MRILLTTPIYPPFNSGLGNAVAQQAAFISKSGHDVVVVTHGEQRSTIHEDRVRIERFSVHGADSWQEMVIKIDDLVTSGSKWNDLSQAGRQAAIELYQPDHTSILFLNVLSLD